MKSIMIHQTKGGVGKTSLAVSIAYELSLKGKTIVLDFDQQGNSTQWILNHAKFEKELVSYFISGASVHDIIQATSKENLYIMPTAKNGNLEDFQEEFTLKKFMNLCEDLERIGFQYVVIDTAPSSGNYQLTLLKGCNEVINIINPERFSVEGLTLFSRRVNKAREQGYKIEYSKIIINNKDPIGANDIAYTEAIKKSFTDFNIFVIPFTRYFKNCQDKSIFLQDEKKLKATIRDELKNVANNIQE